MSDTRVYIKRTQLGVCSSYIGVCENPAGLLLSEANGGDLQQYFDHNPTINTKLQIHWRLQAAEAIEYIHSKGVIHSDLRPENYLIHKEGEDLPRLLLCDFGSSFVSKDIDGEHLPDSGFFDPNQPWESTPDTDIFSLGSVMYVIMTGHWPYRSLGRFQSMQEKIEYETKVDTMFANREYPCVSDLVGGYIISGCWTALYHEAKTIVSLQRSLLDHLCIEGDTRNRLQELQALLKLDLSGKRRKYRYRKE